MTTGETNTQAEAQKAADSNTNRRQPYPQGFLDVISSGWAER